MGRYGPMVQIGDVNDEEKPQFAKLKNTQSIETISFEEAMELFKLPRNLGQFEDSDVTGEHRPVSVPISLMTKNSIRLVRIRSIYHYSGGSHTYHCRKTQSKGRKDHQGIRKRKDPIATRTLWPIYQTGIAQF